MNKFSISFILSMLMLPYAFADDYAKNKYSKLFTQNVFHLTEVMVKDVASPPVASRFYMYSILAAYETYSSLSENHNSIASYFHWECHISSVGDNIKVNKEYASIVALLKTGQNLMPSGYLLVNKLEELKQIFLQDGIDAQLLAFSEAYAVQIVDQIVALANNDGYKKLNTYRRYSPANQEGSWHPTPPAYIQAIEPYWNTMRTFFIKDLKEFAPPPPEPFDLNDTSQFMKMTKEVYDVSFRLTHEQKEIASFWDCNPFAVKVSGHLSIGIKKISPGGHWISIAGIACEKAKFDFEETIRSQMLVACGLYESFISCWKEKYRSDRIRPETVINRHIDANWRPFLQTPPFPEYTSGHSVISSCAATILTEIFGNRFAFEDNSEVIFGLPIREFTSFLEASDEAAISRLYGGIHYKDAIERGVDQGKKIGNFIIDTLPKKFFSFSSN